MFSASDYNGPSIDHLTPGAPVSRFHFLLVLCALMDKPIKADPNGGCVWGGLDKPVCVVGGVRVLPDSIINGGGL